MASLTEIEREVLRGIVAGCSARQIAIDLDLPVADVGKHKASLLRKLNSASTADLVRVGIYADC